MKNKKGLIYLLRNLFIYLVTLIIGIGFLYRTFTADSPLWILFIVGVLGLILIIISVAGFYACFKPTTCIGEKMPSLELTISEPWITSILKETGLVRNSNLWLYSNVGEAGNLIIEALRKAKEQGRKDFMKEKK
jgi:hypothetical protein